jgi:hypothetical protein
MVEGNNYMPTWKLGLWIATGVAGGILLGAAGGIVVGIAIAR